MAADKIQLKVGEATYELGTSLNTWIKIEQAFDLGINQVISKFNDTDTLRVQDLKRYLECALQDANGAPLSPQAASTVCDVLGIGACTNAVTQHILNTIAAFSAKPDGEASKP